MLVIMRCHYIRVHFHINIFIITFIIPRLLIKGYSKPGAGVLWEKKDCICTFFKEIPTNYISEVMKCKIQGNYNYVLLGDCFPKAIEAIDAKMTNCSKFQ